MNNSLLWLIKKTTFLVEMKKKNAIIIDILETIIKIY